jgi:hypothetical protein
MMNREKFTEKVSLWLDNQLSSTEVAELQTHINQSVEYQQIYQDMKDVDSLLSASAEMATPPVGFSKRLNTRLEAKLIERQQKKWLAVVALLLGATLLSTIAISVIFNEATFVINSSPILNVQMVYQWQVIFIESVNDGLVIFNLFSLLIKASLLMMVQPLFLVCVIMTFIVTGLWVRLMQLLYHRQPLMLPMLVS